MNACNHCCQSRNCLIAERLHRMALILPIISKASGKELLRSRIEHYLNLDGCVSAALGLS